MTALVLAGGSTRGAIQIGMLQVLAEHGFVPDRVYGSSVGAINGAGFAADPTREGVERMAQIWLGLKREDVYPQGRLHGPWLYLQQRDAVYSNSGLRAIVSQGFPFERLEESTIPLEVVATSLTDGGERWFTRGPAVAPILASAAMPAIFPPVEIDGERYIDGGVVNNVPIQRAIDAGATQIVVLLCSPPIVTPAPSKRPVEGMVNALLIAIHARFVRDMAHLPEGVEIILCSGPEGATRDFDDFSTSEHLIALGRAEASEIVRRYGLGTVPYPAPPLPVPTVAGPAADAGGAEGGGREPDDRARHDGVPPDYSPPDVSPTVATAASPGPPSSAAPAAPAAPGIARVTGRQVAGDPARSGDVAPHDPGRHSRHHTVVGEGAAYDRPGPHHDVPAQHGAGQDHDTGPEPAAVADDDRHVVGPLHVDHLVGVLVTVVLIGDVDVRTGLHVTADLDREVTHDVAAPADHGAVTDPDDGVGHHLLARHHAGGQAHVRADEGVLTDADPLLAEDGARRERQAAAPAEGAEPVGQPVTRSGGAVAGHPVPTGVDDRVEEAVPTGTQVPRRVGHRTRRDRRPGGDAGEHRIRRRHGRDRGSYGDIAAVVGFRAGCAHPATVSDRPPTGRTGTPVRRSDGPYDGGVPDVDRARPDPGGVDPDDVDDVLTDKARLGRSGFATGSDLYERARPGYSDDAVTHLVTVLGIGAGRRVLDVAAGTGKLTRALVATGAATVACEPSASMREVFAATVPGTPQIACTAEQLGVGDGTFDAITVAQAFHWFDAPAALAEFARVLRPGGGLGLVWNERDESDPVVAELTRISKWDVHQPYPVGMDFGSVIDASGRFGPVTRTRFHFTQELDRTGFVEQVASRSYIAVLPGDRRRQILDGVAALAATLEEPIGLPYIADLFCTTSR